MALGAPWSTVSRSADSICSVEQMLDHFALKIQLQLAGSAERPAATASLRYGPEFQTPFAEPKVVEMLDKRKACKVQLIRSNMMESETLTPNTLNFFSLDDSSAARPAKKSHSSTELHCLQECREWIQALPSQLCKSEPLQRLQAAVTILQKRSSRQQRKEVQQLLHTWSVIQKTESRKRKYQEVKQDLLTKVVEETCRLKRMQGVFVEPDQDASANNPSACFSAVRASLHHGSIERLA